MGSDVGTCGATYLRQRERLTGQSAYRADRDQQESLHPKSLDLAVIASNDFRLPQDLSCQSGQRNPRQPLQRPPTPRERLFGADVRHTRTE